MQKPHQEIILRLELLRKQVRWQSYPVRTSNYCKRLKIELWRKRTYLQASSIIKSLLNGNNSFSYQKCSSSPPQNQRNSLLELPVKERSGVTFFLTARVVAQTLSWVLSLTKSLRLSRNWASSRRNKIHSRSIIMKNKVAGQKKWAKCLQCRLKSSNNSL